MSQKSRKTGHMKRWLSHRSPSGALLVLCALFALMLLIVAGCTPTGGGTGAGAAGGETTIRPTTTPPPFETPGPLPAPGTAHGVPAITPTHNGVPAFTTDDMGAYALKHPPEGLIGNGGAGSITRDEFLPSEVVGALLHVPTNQPDGTPLGYVELAGDFTFAGPLRDQPLHFPYRFDAFDATTGNLVLSGGLNQPTPKTPQQPTPTPNPRQPTPTPTPQQQPTATPIPPKLSVTPTLASSNCQNGGWPKITVTNAGGGTLNWNVVLSTLPPSVTASPSSGSLGAGASQDVLLAGKAALGSHTISFSSDGGKQDVSITCK
jgi:hypothetical protein